MTEKAKTTTAKKTDTLAAAFLKAQSEFPEVGKDSEANAGSYSYRYASLPAICRAVLPVLHKHGLALMQTFEGDDLVTRLIHETDSYSSTMPLPNPRQMRPQEYGIAVSYARRYALISMLGIAPDDDVDAQGVEAPAPIQPPLAAPQPAPHHEDDKYLAAVGDLVERGRTALSVIGNTADPIGEMKGRVKRVLSNQGDGGAVTPLNIEGKPARLKFFNELKSTVEAIEGDAVAVDAAGI